MKSKKQSYSSTYDEFYSKNDFSYPKLNNGIRMVKFWLLLSKLFYPKQKYLSAKVLDLGCGTGFWSDCLQRAGLKVIGLDLSRVGVKKGKVRCKGIEFVQGDANCPPFLDKTFDVIFMKSLSLYSTSDLKKIRDLTNSYLDLLKKYGVILIIFASNFSGRKERTYNHTIMELRSIFLGCKGKVYGPFFYLSSHMRKILNLIPQDRLLRISGLMTVLAVLLARLTGRIMWYIFVIAKDSVD